MLVGCGKAHATQRNPVQTREREMNTEKQIARLEKTVAQMTISAPEFVAIVEAFDLLPKRKNDAAKLACLAFISECTAWALATPKEKVLAMRAIQMKRKQDLAKRRLIRVAPVAKENDGENLILAVQLRRDEEAEAWKADFRNAKQVFLTRDLLLPIEPRPFGNPPTLALDSSWQVAELARKAQATRRKEDAIEQARLHEQAIVEAENAILEYMIKHDLSSEEFNALANPEASKTRPKMALLLQRALDEALDA